MKTTLLSLKAFFTICLLCLVGGGVNVMAQETYTYTYTFKKGDLTTTTPKDYTFNGVKWNVTGNLYQATYTSNKGILITQKNNQTNLTFSTSDIPGTITSVIVKGCTGGKNPITISVKVGDSDWGSQNFVNTTVSPCTFNNNGVGEISVNIKNAKTGKSYYLNSLEIKYTTGNVISAPTITPTSQEFSKPFTATISPVEGATIYYTIDGSDPRTSTTRLEYTTDVEIPAATTTLKACAVKGEATSLVSSATYTFVPIYENIADLKAVAVSGEKYRVKFNNAVVTCTHYNNVYIEDNSGAIVFYKKGNGLEEGNTLNGVTDVTYGNFQGLNQLTDLDKSQLTIGTGAEIPVTDVDIATLNANMSKYESMRIRIKKAHVTTNNFDTDKEATLKQGESSILLYKKGSADMDAIQNNAIVDVIGYPTIFKNKDTNTNEIYIWKGDDAMVSTDKFTITPAQYGTYYTEDAFVMPEGVTGYTITSEDGKTLKFNGNYVAGKTVPAKTALLLKATEKLTADKVYTYTIVNSTEVAPTDNLLHGSVEDDIIQIEGAKAYYKLADDSEEGLGFYWANENNADDFCINAAHKAVLVVMTETLSQMRGFSFDSMTTGINHVVTNAEHAKSTVIYDLNGRRVNSLNAAAKGVYIVNGKKVIVK